MDGIEHSMDERGPQPVVRIEPFTPLGAKTRAALDREADDVVRFESS
jgi:hypothetical protein